jgi:hypothetical protein
MAGAFPQLDEHGGVPQELLAGGRQCRSPLVPDEKLTPQQSFKGTNPGTHGRLADMQPLRGADETAIRDNLKEGSGEFDVHATSHKNCIQMSINFACWNSNDG